MVEVYLILTGLIFAAWIALLIWQARRGAGDDWSADRPIVPVSLVEGDEAVVVAEERGRVVYANEQARAWFGMDGGAPSLALMAQVIQPADAFLDLFAHAGHAALRLGQRRLEGMSHPIPSPDGARMVVVLRELTAAAPHAATELDPLRALTLQTDLAQAAGADQVLGPTIDALLRVIEQAVPFDQAEVLLWHAETQTLRVVGRSAKLSATGSLILPEDQEPVAIPVGEGYSGWIALYRQPLRIDDAPARPDYALRPGQMPFQSFVGIPLLLDDRLVGTLELTRRTPDAYSPGDVALLQAVSGQIVAAVEAARLRTEQAARMHELSGLQHISGAISQLGDPQQLYAQLTQRIAFLANVELCGIMLYDPDEETYRSQAPFYGAPESLVRGHRLEMTPGSDLYEAVMHRPWWYTNDPASPVTAALGLDDVQSAIPLRRVAIVPMVIGTRRVGLLLVANKHGGQRFSDADIRSLITFGNQAAMVVENARLYDDAQRRSRELGGLQQIAEAIGALRSPEQLYDQITRRVAELMDVELCGVLLYDPHTHVLVSQRPFYGLDDDETVSFYQLPSPPGSVIAELWQDRPMWTCNDLRRDPLVGDTDLVRMAGAVGIRQMALAPLVVRGARRGMIQVANKRGGDFSEDDARILSLFAGQAAILIDNAQLYGEMQRRTHQAEGLRVITEFASQTRALDETTEQILIALANLYEVEQVGIALVDEARGQLVFEPGNVWGAALDERLVIDLTGPGAAQSALIGRQPVISAAGGKEGGIPALYHAVARRLGWRDVVQTPLVIRDQVIGELTIANRTSAEPYRDTDIQLLSAIATQIAAMIDRMRLYQSTDEMLRARVETLERVGHISRALRQTTEIDRILEEVMSAALRSTGARAASVVLLAPAEDWPAPDEPLIERRVGEQDALPDLTPLERAAIAQGEVIAVDDYAAGEWAPAPIRARSAVSAPLVVEGAPLGVLHLIGGEPGVFDGRAKEFAAALADEAALAVANSRRYQAQLDANHQLRLRADRMDRIFEVGELFRRGASLEELLAEVAESVRESVGFNSVLISLADEDAGVMRRTAYAGLPRAAFEQLRRVSPPLEQARSLMQPEYQVSHSYFLPAEGAEALTEGLPTLQVVGERMGPGARAWHPDDLLLIPLYGAGGRLLGLMSVDDPRSGRRPDQATVEALEAFAGQAAFSIENFRLIARIQHEAEATRRERDRLAQLHLVASEIQRAADVPARLQVVADGIHQAGWGKVFITLRDERLEPTALIQAGYSPEEALSLEVEPGKVWRAWIGDLAFHELKLGAGYYLRYDRPWVRQHVYGGEPPVPAEAGPGEWHPEDTLYLTLVGQDQKRIIGIIGMRAPVDGRVPTASSLQPFELFASQAAAAIETTRLYLETVRAAEQEARLNELMEAVSVSMRPEAVIEAIAAGLQQMVPFTRLHVALGDPDAPQLDLWRAEIALDGALSVRREDPLPAPGTALRLAYEEKAPRIYALESDEGARAQLADLRAWYGAGERSSLIVPMIAGGQPVGALHLGTELAGAPGFAEHLTLIQRLANLSAVALDNARLFDDAQQRAVELDAQARRLGLINRVSTRVSESLDPEEIYQIALNELQAVLGAQYGGVVIYEGDETGLLVLDTHPLGGADQDVRIALRDNPSVEQVRRTQRPLVASDVMSDPRFAPDRPVLSQRGTRAMMVIPLIVGDEVIGSIGLDFTAPRQFTEAEIELAGTIASQVSLALDKARLLRETEQRAAELNQQAQRLAFLNRVSAKLAETLDPDALYRIVLTELQDALGAQYGGLMLLQDGGTISRLVLSTHPLDVDAPADISVPVQGNPIAEYVIGTQQPFMAEDLLHDPRFEPLWEVQEARDVRAMLIVPVIMGGEVIGTIGLDSNVPRRFTEAEIELAKTTANQAAIAIEKARLFGEAQQRARALDEQAQRLALVNRVSTRLAETLDPQELYRIVLSELAEALDVPLAGLVLFESETMGRLVLSYPFEDATPDLLLPLADNLSIEHVRTTHRPLVSTDVLSDRLFEAAWPVLRQRGTRSLMIVPLLVGDSVIGTIGLDSDVRREFTDAEVELVQTIAGQASLAVEKARLYNETLGLTIFNQAVVESIRQGIVVLDRDLRVRRVNGYMREHYGWSEDALGQPLFEYRPDYERFLRQPVAVALERGEPQAQYEIERGGGNGHRSIRNYYVYPMQEGRTVTGIVLLVEDITERALLEADLSSRAMQMAALSEVSSQITSTLEADQVVQLILDALDRVIPYDGVSLWLRSPEREELAIVAARGYRDPDSPDAAELAGLRVEIAHSPLFREMAERAEVINAGDVSAGDKRFPYGAAAVYKNWLGAPLISKGRVVGVLTLEKREPHYYTAIHEQLALTFASQAAVALDNAQLFEETRARATALDEQAQRLALLNRVSLALAQSLDMENILEIALRETAIALDVAEGSAMQIDHPGQVGRAVVDYPRGDTPPDKAFELADSPIFERVRDSLIPLVIENVAADPHCDELRAMMRRPDVSSTMLVPLVIGGIVIGIVRLDSVEPRQFSLAQIELAQTIASQAAIAVQNASLFEQSSIRTRELETLFESAQATAVTLDLDEVARRVAEQVLGALRADAAGVFLWDDVNNRLELRGAARAEPESGPPAPLGERSNVLDYPLRERALRERRLIAARAGDPDLAPGEAALFAARGASGRLLLPLVVNEVSIGLVEVETLDPKRFFKSEEMRLARTLASQAAIAIENARLQTETRRTVEELYIINDLSAALSSATRLDELLAVLDAQLPSLTHAEAIYVALYDAATDTLSFPLATAVQDQRPERRALDLAPRSLGNDEFSVIVRRQTPLLLVGDQVQAVRRNLGIETILPPEAQSFVGVPLFAGEQIIGVLAVRDDDDPLAFSSDDQRLLTTVGSQLGVAIQSARLLQQTRDLAEDLERRVEERTVELVQERQQLSTLYQITTELATGLDIERLLSRALEMVADATGASEAAIFALDPADDRLALRAHTGGPLDALAGEGSPALALREGLARWAIQQHQNVIVDDVRDDPRWRLGGAADEAPRSALVALIEAAEEVLGVMLLGSAQPSAFTVDHLRLVAASTNQIANAMNNAELYSLIRDQAERLGAMLRQEQVEATKSSAILDSVADGVMVADQHGQVIGFNSTAERILGIPGSRVLGRPTSIVAGLYSSGGRWLDTVSRWLKQPHDYQPGEFLEERLSLEDGRVISVRLSPVYLGEQFLGTVSVFRDITREVEVDRLKSEFVATVSHELRTPMTSIKGYADLLLLGAAGEVSEQQQYFLEVIKQNADRLSTLVNDLLDISRIDQQRVVLQLERVAASDVLQETLEHLRERVKDKKREMTLALDRPEAADLTVWGDARKLAQIMANLADNAFNYTLPGGTVTLGARPGLDTDTVILSVADTGIGIPPEVGDRVFERFFRGDEAQELVMDTPGTGLGLSIVKEYVEMLHGRIWYESEPGRGTTFYVELPATGAATPDTETLKAASDTGRGTESELERGFETGPLSRE